jgi:hypothetical protein
MDTLYRHIGGKHDPAVYSDFGLPSRYDTVISNAITSAQSTRAIRRC